MDNIGRFIAIMLMSVTFFPICIIGLIVTATLDLVKGNDILSSGSYSGKFVLMIQGIGG